MTTARRPDVHPAGRTPDRQALADLDAGLAADDAALTADHLAVCPDCAVVLAALRSVRADIAVLAVTPMPAEVAAGIAAALAAEAPVTAPSPAPHPSRPDAADPRIAAAGKPNRQPAEAGRHRRTHVVELAALRRSRWLNAAAGIAAGLVVLGGGTYLITLPSGSDSVSGAASSVEESVQVSGAPGATPTYDRRSLEAAVGQLLGPSLPGNGGADPGSAGPLPEPADTRTVDPACLDSVPVAGAELLTVQSAVYEGAQAIVLILTTEDPARVQVTVVSAECTDGSEPTVLDEFETNR